MQTVIVKAHQSQSTTTHTIKLGNPQKIVAQPKTNYELVNAQTQYAPDHIVAQRIGKDLHIYLGKDAHQADLVLEGYYQVQSEGLLGLAEDGLYYYYIPDTGEVVDYITQLPQNAMQGHALGGQGQVEPWWVDTSVSVPMWLGALPLAGLSGATYHQLKRDKSSSDKNDKLDNNHQPTNHAPSDIELSVNVLPENTAGAIVGKLATIDPDAGDTHTYTISDNRFEVVDGQLKLKDGIKVDFAQEKTIALTITTSDKAGAQYSETITLQVQDDPNYPAPTPPSKLGVYVPAPATDFIANVKDAAYGAKGDGQTDDTIAIQKAIDDVAQRGGGIVDIPAGTYMVDSVTGGGINVRSNVIVRMADDTIVQAIPNDRSSYTVFRIHNADNAHILGGTVVGERDAHQGTAGQGGYGVWVLSSKNVVVENVTAKNFWGDGFLVSRYHYHEANPENVVFYNVIADNNRRQGLSITDGNNIKIIKSVFKNTEGHSPESGIDIEPNPSKHSPMIDPSGNRIPGKVSNVEVIDSVFENNTGYGIVASANGDAVVENVYIINNRMEGNLNAISFNHVIGGEISGNTTLDDGRTIPYFDVDVYNNSQNIIVKDNTLYGGSVRTYEAGSLEGSGHQVSGNHTKAAVFIKGTLKSGETVFAQVEDGNGVPFAKYIEYQWFADGQKIVGATKRDYTITTADSGKLLSVQVAFKDGSGTLERAIGSAVATIDGLQNNTAPTDIVVYGKPLEVLEGKAGASIGRVLTIDNDRGDDHVYTVSDTRFELDAYGRLKLKSGQLLDYNKEPNVDLTITAIDRAGNRHSKNFTIVVKDDPNFNVPTPPTTSSLGVHVPKPTTDFVANVKDARYGAKGDGQTDDTIAIQKAIDDVAQRGGGVVEIPAGTYMIDTLAQAGKHSLSALYRSGLMMKDNVIIKMTNDTVLQALPTDKEGYNLITFYNVHNAHLVGGTLLGERHSHQGIEGQYGYGVRVLSSTNVVIENVTAKDFWGDGFYVGINSSIDKQSENIVFYDVVADSNRRQGLSVTDGKGIKILNSLFKNTAGHMPQSGIDIEPNPGRSTIDIEIRGNTFENNSGYGVVVSGSQFNRTDTEMGKKYADTVVKNIAIENNTFVGNRDGIAVAGLEGGRITGNTIRHANVTTSPSGGIRKLLLDDLSRDIVVENNTIYGGGNPQKGGGIENLGTNNTVSNNTYKADVFVRGLMKVGEVLSAHVYDGDGVPKTGVAYQWLSDGVPITGATNKTYRLTEHNHHQRISVRVEFVDTAGQLETATSIASNPLGTPQPNHPPLWFFVKGGSIVAGKAGAVIGDIGVHDPDVGDMHSFITNDERFEVVGGQLKLKDGQYIDFAREKSIEISIQATDSAGAKFVREVVLSVESPPANHAPSDIELSANVLPENTAGAIVGKLATIDPDAGDTHTYTISDNRFEVVNGQLKLKDGIKVDFAQEKTIALTITTSDKAGAQYSETITLQVQDDPNYPVPTPQPPATNETARVGIVGLAQVGKTLAAKITDDNGFNEANVQYQWFANDVPIQGATQSTYTLTATDESKNISVMAQYTDRAGYHEAPVSDLTPTVITPKGNTYLPKPVNNYVVSVKDGAFNAKGDGQTNDTVAIQKAIDVVAKKGGGVVEVPSGTYMIDGLTSVKMRSNITLKLADDAVLKAIPNDSESYVLVEFNQVENAHMTGGTLVGDRHEHGTMRGEWGHGVGIYSSKNIVVENVVARDFWGDGFSIGRSWGKEQGENITLNQITGDNNRRQAVFITDGKNIKILNSIISNTSGTAPHAGIDLEPDPNREINGVEVRGNTFEGNHGWGLLVSMVNQPNSAVKNVVVEDNLFKNNERAIALWGLTGGRIAGNTIYHDGDERMPNGITISEHSRGVTVEGNTIYGGGINTRLDSHTYNTIGKNEFKSGVYIFGDPKTGKVLTARVIDADNPKTENVIPEKNVQYQWYANGEKIEGATAGTYTPIATDKGKTLSVHVAFTDANGNAETAESRTTLPVDSTPPNRAPNGIRLNGQPYPEDIYVPEGKSGAVIGKITVHDDDPADTHTYFVRDQRFEIVNGVLKLKDGIKIDHAHEKKIFLAVYAYDQDKLSDTQEFNLPVADDPNYHGKVNQKPTDLLLSNDTVMENRPSATIGKLTPIDADNDGFYTYHLSDRRFYVDEQGYLKVRDGVILEHSGRSIPITTTVTDSGDNRLQRTFFIKVQDDPDWPANRLGQVQVEGQAKIGQTLTASVADPDGVPDSVQYQWYANGEKIAGATSANYTVQSADLGKQLTAQARYTDHAGHSEIVESPRTFPVVATSTLVNRTSNDLTLSADRLVENAVAETDYHTDMPKAGNELTLVGAHQHKAQSTAYVDTKEQLPLQAKSVVLGLETEEMSQLSGLIMGGKTVSLANAPVNLDESELGLGDMPVVSNLQLAELIYSDVDGVSKFDTLKTPVEQAIPVTKTEPDLLVVSPMPTEELLLLPII